MSKPVIVITDGFTLNPGDLSWEGLNFGEVHYYDRTAPGQTVARCAKAEVIITNKTPITREVIQHAVNLRVIAVTATGYNIVDIDAARERNIPVCNVPEYGTFSVAQHAMALILELTNHVGVNAAAVQRGEWASSPDFCFTRQPLVELYGKTLGIIGMGRIGQRLATMATTFGMHIIYHARSDKAGWSGNVSLEEVFSKSDYISLHLPLTKENTGFVNKGLLSLMKPTACLINTSRGGLINERDLADALLTNKIRAAALDVLSVEPPPENHVLTRIPNCLITPHTAWMSREARERIMKTTLDNIRLAWQGCPQHVVNPTK
jgi:glycerate dehydrogenase